MPDTSDKMALDPANFLRKNYVLNKVLEKMNPALLFDESFFPRIKADAKSFTYYEDTNSDASDSEKADPVLQTSLTHFPRVKISSLTQVTGKVKRYGISVAFDEDILQFGELVDMVNRSLDRVGYWIADFINVEIGKKLVGAAWNTDIATDSTTDGPRVFDAAAVWDGTSAVPARDLNKMSRIIAAQTTHDYNVTDVYLRPKSVEWLNNYLMGNVASAAAQAWVMDPKDRNAFQVPSLGGLTLHKAKVGTGAQLTTITSGTQYEVALCLDRAHPAITMFYNSNPRYDGDFVQVHNWLDDETGELVYKFQVQFGMAKMEKLSVGLIEKLLTL